MVPIPTKWWDWRTTGKFSKNGHEYVESVLKSDIITDLQEFAYKAEEAIEYDDDNSYNGHLRFENDEDMVLFVLKWGNHINKGLYPWEQP